MLSLRVQPSRYSCIVHNVAIRINPRTVHQRRKLVRQCRQTYKNRRLLKSTVTCPLSTVLQSSQINRQCRNHLLSHILHLHLLLIIESLATCLVSLFRKTDFVMENKLIRVFHNPHFDIRAFREKLRIISYCKKGISKDCDTKFQNSGFE